MEARLTARVPSSISLRSRLTGRRRCRRPPLPRPNRRPYNLPRTVSTRVSTGESMGAMIKTVNLTKRYGTLVALSNLNLEIDEGDCFGFIGPNGAGKSTTIKILATLLQPTWGEA